MDRGLPNTSRHDQQCESSPGHPGFTKPNTKIHFQELYVVLFSEKPALVLLHYITSLITVHTSTLPPVIFQYGIYSQTPFSKLKSRGSAYLRIIEVWSHKAGCYLHVWVIFCPHRVRMLLFTYQGNDWHSFTPSESPNRGVKGFSR